MICPTCNEPFDRQNPWQKFCSPVCKREGIRRRQRVTKDPVPKVCRQCGGEFSTVIPQQAYCSDLCRTRQRQARESKPRTQPEPQAGWRRGTCGVVRFR